MGWFVVRLFGARFHADPFLILHIWSAIKEALEIRAYK